MVTSPLKKIMASAIIMLLPFPFSQAASSVDSIIGQFDGYTINGKTAKEIAEPIIQKSNEDGTKQLNTRNAEYDRIANEYNKISTEEIACRDVIARMTSPYASSNPYDFIKVGNTYIHWLSDGTVDITCRHYSLNDLENHAKLFSRKEELYLDAINAKQNINRDKITKDTNDITLMNVKEALKPFYNLKREKLSASLPAKNSEIGKITCTAIIPGSVENGIFHPTHVCDAAVHKIVIAENNDGILGYTCSCGHSLELHQITYNKKVTKPSNKSKDNESGKIQLKSHISSMADAVVCSIQAPSIKKVKADATAYYMTMDVKVLNKTNKKIAEIKGYMVPYDRRGNRYSPVAMEPIHNLNPGKSTDGIGKFWLVGPDKDWIVEAVYKTMSCENILDYDVFITSILFDDGTLLTH